MSRPILPARQPGLWLSSVVLCLAGVAWALPPNALSLEASMPTVSVATSVASIVQPPSRPPLDVRKRASLPDGVLALVIPKPGTELDHWPEYIEDSARRCLQRYAPDYELSPWRVRVDIQERRIVSVDVIGLHTVEADECMVRHIGWARFDLQDGQHRAVGATRLR